MNLERAAMKGEMAELEKIKARLRLKAEGLCQSLRQLLNTALTDIEDQDVDMQIQQFEELQNTHMDLAVATGKITRLKRELG